MNPQLKEKLGQLPDQPGCYLFRDARGRIIYVGKAVSLRRRVQNYFRNSTRAKAPPKLRSLLNSIADLSWIAVPSEAEALLTESRLIKDYRPRFNVVFRDDKRYLSIRADPNMPCPRFQTCRIVRDDGAEYFGPFPSADVVHAAIDFVEKHYGIRKCAPWIPDAETYRHCLNDIIRLCSAPCIQRISADDYRARFDEARAFLRGRRPLVMETLAETMRQCAAEGRYEKAALLRDTLAAVREITRRRLRMTSTPEIRKEDARHGIEALQEILHLPAAPRLIDAFDISNLFGAHAVGGMVCAINGIPRPQRYRRFRIRSVKGSDDPRMMAEAVVRCYRRRIDENGALPDLILVDGGITQLRASRDGLRSLGLEAIPVVGLAKRYEELIRDHAAPPLRLPPDSPALHVLQRLRDEAHRFSLNYHQRLRARLFRESALDEIPGIGPTRKKMLLRRFGSVRGMAHAAVEEIAALPGITPSLAESILRVAKGSSTDRARSLNP